MNLEELRFAIRQLVAVKETTAPVVSCYVDLEGGRQSYRLTLDERTRTLRSTLDTPERETFEMALAQIEVYLGTAVGGSTKGVAIFSRAIDGPILQALQFHVPLPNKLSIGALPSIYPLVQLKDAYHRYVVLITTQEHARILEVAVGTATRSLWAERPELRKRVGRIWSHEHYQNHRRDRGDKFVKEKIRLLERVVSGGGHSHLILAGSAEAVARVRGRLPKRLSDMLVDVVMASSRDKDADIVEATLACFIDHEQQESVITAGRLKNELRRGGLAGAGTDSTLRALRQTQVDVLVMAHAYEPPEGWMCGACGALAAVDGTDRPAACPQCGEREIRPANLQEEMVRLAEEQDAEVEIVRESDALLDLGGVGCLPRFWTTEQHLKRSSRTRNPKAEVADSSWACSRPAEPSSNRPWPRWELLCWMRASLHSLPFRRPPARGPSSSHDRLCARVARRLDG
jgi:hypothetical protein